MTTMLLGGAMLAAGGCTDDIDRPTAPGGGLTLNLSISGEMTRADNSNSVNGQDAYNENKVSTLDLFFYASTADDNTSAEAHVYVSNIQGTSTTVPAGKLSDLTNGSSAEVKIIAVANCPETRELTSPSVNDLKAVTTKTNTTTTNITNAFRSATAPGAFVMTNLSSPTKVTVSEEQDTKASISLRRVAAKIRLAISVEDHLADENGDTWTPDLEEMRLFINSGVRTARLDGNVAAANLADNADAEQSDYYSIATSGTTESKDFEYSRLMTGHTDGNNLTGSKDETYIYYNELPLYTYPNTWQESVTEEHQTFITLVVPWVNKESGETTYQPTYYKVPVNTDGTIISNAYYYVRAHIGMMGSVTPESPMPVEIKSETANWGTADDTKAELRPLRFLIFQDTEFVMNNETEITIPFASTHNCKVIDFEVSYYKYDYYYGQEKERWFDNTVNTNGNFLYSYSIDNEQNTLTFKHAFFEKWSTTPAQTSHDTNRTKTTAFSKPANQNTETTTFRRMFSRFDIKITVQHNSGDGELDPAYCETLYLTAYPAIYINTEYIEGYGLRNRDGWILINGYGIDDNNTGHLGNIQASAAANPSQGQAGVMTTLTLTQLNDEEAATWSIGDPRKNFINNELDDESMLSDIADHTDIWNLDTYGGPFDGTQYAGGNYTRWNGNNKDCRTIWQYYAGSNWIIGSWNAANDVTARPLRYYYPTEESLENGKTIGPKVTMVSHHAYTTGVAHFTRDIARKRCAAFQQYGYPAGRWRLPTKAEIQIVKQLQAKGVLADVFGGSNNWSAQGAVDANGEFNGETTSYIRCIYDTWYWEQVDAEGNQGLYRIPEGNDKENWKIFTWGDRPKENVLTRGGETSVQKYMQNHSKGNYRVKRQGDNVKLEKMD